MRPSISVWPPLSPGVHLRPAARSALPWPVSAPGASLFSKARHGLFLGLGSLGLGAGDRVLVPNYHHGSEVEALVRTGVVPVFYHLDEGLEPDEEHLDRAIQRPCAALYLTHYLGFAQDAGRWREWCDRRGMLLIEDAAQAFLASDKGTPAGADADLSIFCLYKTYGLPDGAVLNLRTGDSPSPDGTPAWGLRRLTRRHGSWTLLRLGHRLPTPRPDRAVFSDESDRALGDPETAPGRFTRYLIPRVVRSDVARQRRANYLLLLQELGDVVSKPFSQLPVGASPFVFPIEVDDKQASLARLRERGIQGLDMWSRPHPAVSGYEGAMDMAMRSRAVGLPVHQELRPDDLLRIVDAVRGRIRRI